MGPDEHGMDVSALDEREAFAAIALACSAIDGEISQQEYDTAYSYLGRMRLYKDMPHKDFHEMTLRLYELLEQHGAKQLMHKAIDALPERLKKTAFTCAVDIAFADGGIEETEKNLIQELYRALNVSESTAQKIVEVMKIKNYG